MAERGKIPLCCFDIFYNGALEFSLAPPTTRLGRVHANGPIYVGSAASHYFIKTVSTTSTISSIAVDGQTSYGTSSTFFLGTPATLTNGAALLLFVSTLTNNAHVLIDIPPAAENPMSSLGQERFYNKAQMVLLVTNDATGLNTNPTVTLLLRTSVNGAVPGNDPAAASYTITNASPDTLAGSFPFLALTNNFYDRREQKTNIVTDFDVGIFASWAATNEQVQAKLPASASVFPTILFVSDQRTKTSYQSGQLAVVRARNGAQLPFNNGSGFTLATPNPLYVLGNYNIQIPGSTNLSLSTNDTTYTVPAALISDALTVFASTWADTNSYSIFYSGSSLYKTTNTTINAAIITGTMPSTGTSGTTFSGGVHNLPRLLQDWINSGVGNGFWLNTSIICLWDSRMATNQFRNPPGFNPTPVNPYYNPPSRHFNFDTNFLNPAKMPPGIPSVSFSWPTNQ